MNNFGWDFWKDAEVFDEEDGVKIYKKDSVYCVCDNHVEPGDADSDITFDVYQCYDLFWNYVNN